MSTFNRREDQAKLPKRTSKSGQTTLKDLRSNRSHKSAPRNNHNNKKNRASAKSALGPIHSSKVSKAAGRKTPRPQRPSKIPAERDNVQNQGLNITISPPPPANVAPRRSRRLSTNQKRSGALEADLAAELGRRSKPKGRVAGTKPDRRCGKSRGISKTQGRDLSRKRTEIHT